MILNTKYEIRESCTCVHDDIYTELISTCVVALYQYFEKASVLPNPDGPSSTQIPSSAIAKANKEVKPLIKKSTSNKSGKRGQYLVYTDEEKLKIGKQAAEMGATSTIRFFQKEFGDVL